MPEDRRPTGIVAKRLAQGTCSCPMQHVREVRLAARARWQGPDAVHHLFLHLAAGRLEGLPARATALLAAGSVLRAGDAPVRLTVVPLAFRHDLVGDPLRRLALPVALPDPRGGACWSEIAGAAAAARAGDGWQRVRCRGLVQARLGGFLALACARGRLQPAPRDQPGWLTASLALLRRRLADPSLAVSDLAATAGLSSDAFGRVFRAATGETPWAMVLRLRLGLAESLLREGLPVKTTAARSGFASASRLISIFRRRHGMPPAAWARTASAG